MNALSVPPDFAWRIETRVESEANRRGRTMVARIIHDKRVASQRSHAKMCAFAAECWGLRPSAVRLTRIAPRELDSDNLPMSMKALRDGTADAFGCDDSKRSGIEWMYVEVWW